MIMTSNLFVIDFYLFITLFNKKRLDGKEIILEIRSCCEFMINYENFML